MKQRILSVDFVKFISIFLVVWCHVIEGIDTDGFWQNSVHHVVYSFHMPLFMLLSGYFSYSSLNKDWKEIFVSKFCQLILPTFLFYIIQEFILYSLSFTLHIPHTYEPPFNAFWFLKCLFLCYIILYLSLKFKILLVSVIVLTLFPYIPWLVSFMYPYFVLGYLTHKIESKYHFLKKYVWISIPFFVFCLYFWDSEYTIYNTPIKIIDYRTGTFDINNLYVTFYRFFIGLLGSLSVYFVIVKIYSSIKNLHIVHWMTSYGMYTMGIYLIHIILVKVLKLIFYFSRMDEIYIDLISLILSIFFVFIVVKILNIVNKNKISRLLLLGKK